MIVLGVDGCPRGWIAVRADLAAADWRVVVYERFADLLSDAGADVRVIGVDSPIGLPEEGGRECDRLARFALGPRRSSVFNPPSRRLLALIDGLPYREANARAQRELGHGIGAQAFNIFPKVREVDALMTPERQRAVREVHPELCFTEMTGAPCHWPKRLTIGRDERWARLRAACSWLGAAPRRHPSGAGEDDLLDALAAAWTAARLARGTARSLPSVTVRDPRGLAMEVCI